MLRGWEGGGLLPLRGTRLLLGFLALSLGLRLGDQGFGLLGLKYPNSRVWGLGIQMLTL